MRSGSHIFVAIEEQRVVVFIATFSYEFSYFTKNPILISVSNLITWYSS